MLSHSRLERVSVFRALCYALTVEKQQILLQGGISKNSRSTSSYRATEWRDMSFVDLLLLKNRENVAQNVEYIFSRSERFQFKSLLLGGGPWDKCGLAAKNT